MLFFAAAQTGAQTLNVPPRPAGAPTGSQFINIITPMSLTERENWIYAQVVSGNVPNFQRTLVPITVSATINGTRHTATYYAAPDYLAIGHRCRLFPGADDAPAGPAFVQHARATPSRRAKW